MIVDRSRAPQFFRPERIIFPEPECIKLPSGSRFLSLNIGDQPVIKLEFIFRSGTWYESKPGIAFFTGKMLVEGSQNFSSKQIAEKFEMFGAFVEINVGFDDVNLSIHIPSRHLDNLLEVIRDVLFFPTFPEQELEIMKKIQIQQLKVNQQKNNFVAGRLFRSKLYQDTPYGHLITRACINEINKEELKNHFETWMLARFECFLTGDFDDTLKGKILNLIDQNSNSLKELRIDLTALNTHFNIYEEVENSLQSSIFMGRKCLNRSDKNYPGMLLLNEIFGGYFGSRLMQNIRENKGYTYGIYSHIVALRNGAYFIINSEVKKENRDDTLNEIDKEIIKIKQEPVGDEELRKVKNFLHGSMVNSLTSPFEIINKIKILYLYDLNMDFYDNLFDEIDNTDEVDILRLANEILFDQKLSAVVVG